MCRFLRNLHAYFSDLVVVFHRTDTYIPSTSGRLHSEFIRLLFLQDHREKCGNILAKAAPLRINLDLDGTPITSQSYTHPSHSQTSRLLTSSLSLGVPVPRTTQCIRGV